MFSGGVLFFAGLAFVVTAIAAVVFGYGSGHSGGRAILLQGVPMLLFGFWLGRKGRELYRKEEQ